ncbi:uncharacterized protein NEMAJ01_0963 [Nematocida major]|uniref:uncharacterized protein n=1 Tax=Nematocida major TaxID=1912982 RepID=UPI002007CE2D|nr:uncharacterized protein NEMAJ01_0963 [Nematocida major]KAH9386067.1 hypothetical protein NEMAJ01_0963 [Nematocida major]
MVKPRETAQASPEQAEMEKMKAEARRKKEAQEKQEQEEYIQRVRRLIQEDRKNNLEKAQVEIDGLKAMQSASMIEAEIKPLTASKDRQSMADPNAEGGITIKIIHETQKKLHTFPATSTVSDFKSVLKEHFKIKKPKAFISASREINFEDLNVSLVSLGVSDMDTVYVHSM